MTRIPFVLATLAALAVVPTLAGHTGQSRKTPKGVQELMQRKLAESQKVLEGIALQDFDQIADHAQELIVISNKTQWRVLDTPLYELYSDDFRRSAADLVKNARKKNVDAAALSYVDLTLTCVKCHKHIREKRMARRD